MFVRYSKEARQLGILDAINVKRIHKTEHSNAIFEWVLPNGKKLHLNISNLKTEDDIWCYFKQLKEFTKVTDFKVT